MTISATVIEHSESTTSGARLVTVLARYPRYIHSELMTHRQFSRNASSSRAIPVAKLIENVETDLVYPSQWGANNPGMQSIEELTVEQMDEAKDYWDMARRNAVRVATKLAELGAHKQIVNRILEPFAHINTLITATEWGNFFELRCHPDADPTMQAVGCAIHDAIDASTPKLLRAGEWHLPFITTEERAEFGPDMLRRASAARCARTSYLTHDFKPPAITGDIRLYNKLVGSRPIHASPTEHQATPDILHKDEHGLYTQWKSPHLHGNFFGWVQFRKLVEKEMAQ